jgi:omega-6 fatty acid desaturase (delta-12 desaturase)
MEFKNKLVLDTMRFTQEDPYLSWYYFLSTTALVVMAFLGIYWIPFTIGKMVVSLLAGLLASRLFVIYHDYHHEAILRRSVIAKVLMTIFGMLTLAPPSIWKETHQHHHNNNAKFSRIVIGSFPTITTKMFLESTSTQKFWYLLLRHPLMILFGYVPIFLVSFCLWPFFENPKKYYDGGIAAAVHGFLIWIVYAVGGWALLWYAIFLPCLIMFAVGGYIFYAQHNSPKVVLKDEDSWDYLDAALSSSSYIKMNRILRWFTANIGYHHIHHVNSRIPFYYLPKVMDHFGEFQNPRTTSLYPPEIWKCLRLKLWDENLGRLITLKEFRHRYDGQWRGKASVSVSNSY